MLHKTTLFSVLIVFVLVAAVSAQDWRNGIPWKKPEVITPAAKPGDPPSDAIILFNGKDMSEWNKEWAIEKGELLCVPGKGEISTKRKFGSVQLHIEFATPSEVSGSSQGRGNSGVFFGPYELQVLDSYENETYFDGQCGSIYKQVPPLVNVCRKPGEWQTYDVIFNRPELKIENDVVYVIRPGYITVLQNGVLILNRHQILGTTYFHRPPAYEAHEPLLPIKLQDHGNTIRFRNIWVREIPDTNVRPEPTREPYYMQ
ncbi:MAG: DUF1080 domain-containing protein [Planctomycetaceae bacterium]|jgi:hypothetical protein|nr:DUF1080 domain-containing protein [Planctomycetaceae bacterium]